MEYGWSLPAGYLLNGRYRIIQSLDRDTYSAEDTTLDRSVLLTEYFPVGAYRSETLEVGCFPQDEASYQKGLDNFLRSGSLGAKCIEQSSAILPVFDVFQANSTGYIVEKYIEGVSFEQIVRKEGPISAERMLSWLEPVVKSLAEIHRAGFFHQAIAPDCFLRNTDGVVWLTGFHQDARHFWLESAEEKREFLDTKTVYVPLEAFTSHSWGAYSDIYSLCAVMYDCLSGQRPVHILDRLDDKMEPFPDSGLLEKILNPRQAQVIIKGLSIRPEDRWQSVEEFWSALCGSDTEDFRHKNEEKDAGKGGDAGCKNRNTMRKLFSAIWRFLCKGRGDKKISILHFLIAAAILSVAFAGLIWANLPEPLTPEQERQAMLMELGGFRSGDLSYEFVIPDVPTVWVSGYVGTGTEVTIPEEVNGFPVAGVSLFALKENGLETVYLPDSIAYDPNDFPEGCTVIGGKPKESGGSSLEQQLEEAAKAAETE